MSVETILALTDAYRAGFRTADRVRVGDTFVSAGEAALAAGYSPEDANEWDAFVRGYSTPVSRWHVSPKGRVLEIERPPEYAL
jgi:hypothetical protein